MRIRNQTLLGWVLVGIGLLILFGNLLNINLWKLFWPLFFIGIGVWVILRPYTAKEGTAITQRLIGDIHRQGQFPLRDEEIFLLIGDVDLDLREALFPEGETCLHILGFAGDVNIQLPEDAALKLVSMLFAGSVRWNDRKEEGVLQSFQGQTEGYERARKRLSVRIARFAGDISVQWEGESIP